MPTSSFWMWGASSPQDGASNIRSSKMACGGQHECRIPTFALRKKDERRTSVDACMLPGAHRGFPEAALAAGPAPGAAALRHANNAKQKAGHAPPARRA